MAVEVHEGSTSLSMWRRALPQPPEHYGWFMAKHEHMSTPRALAHAALIGHLARGTVMEGKSFDDALDAARRAVGDDSRHFIRHRVVDPYAGGPMMDEAYYPR